MPSYVPDHLTELNDKQKQFVVWLTTPPQERQPNNMREFALELEVSLDTLYRWKRYPSVRRLQEAVLASLNISPDRVQRIVDQMYADATDPKASMKDRLAAMKAYLAYIGRMVPAGSYEEKADSLTLDEATDEELELMEQALISTRDELAERRKGA